MQILPFVLKLTNQELARKNSSKSLVFRIETLKADWGDESKRRDNEKRRRSAPYFFATANLIHFA